MSALMFIQFDREGIGGKIHKILFNKSRVKQISLKHILTTPRVARLRKSHSASS